VNHQADIEEGFEVFDDERERQAADELWYQLKTALTLIQATGRPVRSVEDWVITVTLDSAFERFLIKNQDILPEWWKAAIEFK
jgi:Rad3-related DNA helicase